MKTETRSTTLTLRISPREREMLDELAELDALAVSEYVRTFIRTEHVAAFGRPKARTERARA